MYLPGFRVTVTVDLPPIWTVLPCLSTPLPSTAIAWGTGEGLSIVIVTLPPFALSDGLSNLSWPLESAAIVRFEPLLALFPALPPLLPDPDVDVGAGAGAGWAVVELDLLSLPPHPATASAARDASAATAGTVRFMGPPWSSSRLVLRTLPESGSSRSERPLTAYE